MALNICGNQYRPDSPGACPRCGHAKHLHGSHWCEDPIVPREDETVGNFLKIMDTLSLDTLRRLVVLAHGELDRREAAALAQEAMRETIRRKAP